MGGRSARRALSSSIASLIIAGCVPSHRMTPELVPGRSCPDSADAWYFPEEASDNRVLEAWCASVGPPVLVLRPSGAFPDLEPGADLTAWSWNVAAGAGDLRRFLQLEVGLRCAGPQSVLEPGAGHFALLVQEAFRRSSEVPEAAEPSVIPRAVAEEGRPGGRPDIVEVAERCGLALVYVAAARNGGGSDGGMREDRGVAILSTLPLSDVWFIELPYEAARRVAVAATVRDAAGRGVRLVNVHFTSAPPPARMLVTGNGSRLRQSLAVADALALVEETGRSAGSEDDGGLTTLLAGDFNTWSDSETALIHLRERFPDSPPALDLSTRGAFPTDHILVREGPAGAPEALDASYARVEERHNSDHHGIRLGVRFPR
jgi:endonuclease/exonuclease/phosphatase family metal-dependent hydrolase